MKSVFSKIAEDKTELAKHEVNLGLIQDITKDLNTVADSLVSIRPALLKVEDVLIKNIKTIDMTNKAIERVEATAKDLGADSFLKELQKPKALVNEFNKTAAKVLKSVQNGIADL